MSEPQTQPKGRGHCRVFVHEALPTAIVSDPGRAIDHLRGPEAQAALDAIWGQVAAVLTKNGESSEIMTMVPTSEPVQGNGWRGIVIHMPKVEQIGECALMMIVTPELPVTGTIWRLFEERDAPLVRFFVLKLLQLIPTQDPELKLCELSVLLGNVTTGSTCAANTADFVRSVVECFEVEG